MIDLQKSLKECDSLNGDRKIVLELAQQTVHRTLDNNFNILCNLFNILPDKHIHKDISAFIEHLKVLCVSWYLPDGKMPEEFTLLEEDEINALKDYAKQDLYSEINLCYFTSLRLEALVEAYKDITEEGY